MTVIAISHISKPTHDTDEEKPGENAVTKRKKKNKKNKKKKNDKELEEPSLKIKAPEEDDKNVAGVGLLGIKKETVTINDNKDDDDDDENDDGELLAAAALWAGDGDGETSDGSNDPSLREEDSRNNHQFSSISPVTKISSTTAALQPSPRNQVYSLHITQLPYDSTEFDLRKLFAEHGCSKIKSIRLVYDHDTRGQKTVFRGVAFIDLLDSNSYEVALKLHHKTSIRGRKLSIRPCRSKEELAEIVSRTKELVQEKIRQQRSLERGEGESGVVVGKSSSLANRNDQKIAVNCSQSDKRKNDGRTKSGRKKSPKVDAGGKPIKLTKKERNRRAAVIMSLKRKR